MPQTIGHANWVPGEFAHSEMTQTIGCANWVPFGFALYKSLFDKANHRAEWFNGSALEHLVPSKYSRAGINSTRCRVITPELE